MLKYEKREVIQKSVNIPGTPGIILFASKDKVLFVKRSSNMKKSLDFLLSAGKGKNEIFQMLSLTDTIAIKETQNLFSALIEEKIVLSQSDCQFKNLSKTFNKYVYLGIDFNKTPFFNVCEDTQNNLFYIGPFLKRFFIFDFLETMADYYKLPLCEDEKYPCDRLKNKKCLGYCLKTSFEKKAMFTDNYIFVNQSAIDSLHDEIEYLMDNLSFEDAERKKVVVKLQEDYYRYLKFFHVTKSINQSIKLDNNSIIIKNGIVETIITGENRFEFPVVLPNFRDNEVLAIDTANLPEAWIVFNYLNEINSQKLTELYEKSVNKLNNKWSEY